MKIVLKKDLTAPKDIARGRINATVEAFRVSYLTPGSAQAMIYGEKNAEIARYRAIVARGETPREEDFPYAMIDARLYGMSLDNGIAFLEFFGDQWRTLAPPTEELRRTALVAIDNAASESAIAATVRHVEDAIAAMKISQR